MRRFLATAAPLLAAAALLLAGTTTAEAASCFGKGAKVLRAKGKVNIKRGQTVMLANRKRVKVTAEGDNRICSKGGPVNLVIGKGNANRVNLGPASDTVVVAGKSNLSLINAGGGKNRVIVKAKANRREIVTGNGNDTITIRHKTNRVSVNSGGGNDRITLLAKANIQSINAGGGHDRVVVAGDARANKRTIHAGLGNDVVDLKAKGNTTTYLGPNKVPPGAADTDTFRGNASNDRVFDYGGGTDSKPNVIRGGGGVDRLYSLGTARSNIFGGNGSDFLYSANKGDGRDRMFGERGNDRLYADRGGAGANGAYMDGAEGDDWAYGGSGPDTILFLSGIKKIWGGDGNDLIIRTGVGIGTIHGQGGYDTVSYIAHTPPGYNSNFNGVMVDLQQGRASAGSKGLDNEITGIEHLIGSPFDDRLIGTPGPEITIEGGPGDDEITGYSGNRVDGGLGENVCEGGGQRTSCNRESPGRPGVNETVLDIGEEGILTVIGSQSRDVLDISYDRPAQEFRVRPSTSVLFSRACAPVKGADYYSCPAPADLLSTASISTRDGDDRISLRSIPAQMNMVVDGGPGLDWIQGSESREVTFHVERGNTAGGNDQVWADADTVVNTGPGSDTAHIRNACAGGVLSGGPGHRDGLVFAAMRAGVWVSMRTRTARLRNGNCAKPIRFTNDWEGLEGTRANDYMIGHPRRGISFLGRDGIDTFDARNGKRDRITVGGEGRKNKVLRDRMDKVTWNWGYAAF